MDLQHHSDNDNRACSCPFAFDSSFGTEESALAVDEEDVYAVLHYDGAPNAQPTTRADRDPDDVLQEYQLSPLENPGPPGGSGPADRVIDLEFSRSTSGGTKVGLSSRLTRSTIIDHLSTSLSGCSTAFNIIHLTYRLY